MIIPLTILGVGIVALALFLHSVSRFKISEINSLENQRVTLKGKFDFMISQRRELRKEVEDKERQLATLRNNQEGIKTISARDLDIVDVDENEKVSRYLIQEGKITLEQNEKVLQKMEIMQMDYIGSCLALGYIDLNTAKKAVKINKISSKSAAFN